MSNLSWITARPIAHRGYHDMNHMVFENTLSAFDRAVNAGFAIECDLQFAADGVPVVFHDDTLDRLCHMPGDVRAFTSGELAQLSVGRGQDCIASFESLLQRVAGRVPVIAELKGRPGEDTGFAGSVLDALDDYRGHAALMSFDQPLLADFRRLQARHPIGLTAAGTVPEKLTQHEAGLDIGVDFVSYGVHDLPNGFARKVRQMGLPLITWTVRDAEGVALTRAHADQMTFEGFDPDGDAF